MLIKVDQVADLMGIPAGLLEARALNAYLRQQLAEAEAASHLAGKYGVSSPQELKAAIESGRFPEHPTWEDVIGWNNLVSFAERTQAALRLLEDDQQQ